MTATDPATVRPAEATGDAERVAELERERGEWKSEAEDLFDMRYQRDVAEARACAAHMEVARLMREVERQRNRSDAAEQDYNAAVEAFRSGLGPAEARAQAAEEEVGRLRDAASAFLERYVGLIWDPEKEPEVIALRAALAPSTPPVTPIASGQAGERTHHNQFATDLVRSVAFEEAAKVADRFEADCEEQMHLQPSNSSAREACAQGAVNARLIGRAILALAARDTWSVP